MTLSWRPALAAHLLALVCALALNPQLRSAGDLGFYDSDYNHIEASLEGPQALKRSWRNIFGFLLTDEPLFNVYHAVRYHFLGADPRPHHLLQGSLLAANAVLAFSLVWRLSRNYLLSFVFLFLFLTYPNRGEAHYWPGAVYVPMLLCLLVSLHLALAWLRESRRWTYAAGWLAYSAAIFTHEAAFGFLGILAALWMLERRAAPRWREGLVFLIPFAATNAVYVILRQTRWLGFGNPGYLFLRGLAPELFFENLASSLRLNFGEPFLVNSATLLGEAAGRQSLLPAFAGILTVLLGVAAVRDVRGFRWRLEGALVLLAAVAGTALYTVHSPIPSLVIILQWGPRALALVVMATVLKSWLAGRPLDPGLTRLAAFGAAWFFAAFAPTYVFYIAGRHNYLPSAGVCLAIAVALWLPAAVTAGDERRRGLLEGASLALAALLSVAFYGACLGQAARWTEAARFINHLKSQLLAQHPSLPPGAKVVILDIPPVLQGVPLLPGYALDAAVRVWYRNPRLAAARDFVPRRTDFHPHADRPLEHHSYDHLLLFTYDHQRLVRRNYLVFEDGVRVRLGAAYDQGSGAGETAPLAVVAGRPRQ